MAGDGSLFFFMTKNAMPAIIAIPTIEPITAPTMIPVLSSEFDDVAAAVVGAAVVTVVTLTELIVGTVTLPAQAGLASATVWMAVARVAGVMALAELIATVNVTVATAESTEYVTVIMTVPRRPAVAAATVLHPELCVHTPVEAS